jgi:hypothetical protein
MVGPNKKMRLKRKILYKLCIDIKVCKGKIISSYGCTKIRFLDAKS